MPNVLLYTRCVFWAIYRSNQQISAIGALSLQILTYIMIPNNWYTQKKLAVQGRRLLPGMSSSVDHLNFVRTLLTPKCPRAVWSFLKFAVNWTKSQHFHELYEFFWIVTVQIQTRCLRDHIRKEHNNITYRLKIIMFDHEGVKSMKIFQFSFSMSTLRSWSLKKYEVLGCS